jgi:hypothetical protein
MKYKIRMLKNQPGVDDGHMHPKHFAEGEEHEIGEELYKSFVELGVVELVEGDGKGKPKASQRETKVVTPEEAKDEESEDETELKEPKKSSRK